MTLILILIKYSLKLIIKTIIIINKASIKYIKRIKANVIKLLFLSFKSDK
jgi:hypothetical protein